MINIPFTTLPVGDVLFQLHLHPMSQNIAYGHHPQQKPL